MILKKVIKMKGGWVRIMPDGTFLGPAKTRREATKLRPTKEKAAEGAKEKPSKKSSKK